jgi:hypothetical protein
MKTITTNRAKEICDMWHGGQWSALYQFASSGVYTAENHLRYLQEIESDLHPEYNLYPGSLSKRNERELNSLKKFFINTGVKNGIYTEYAVHPVYGYNIPFVTESSNNIDKIKQLKYLV